MNRLVEGVRKRLIDFVTALGNGPRYTIERVAEIPDRLKPRIVYILGTPDPWSVALLCPCGCHDAIHISLLANDSPSWRLRIHAKNEPSLEPSVWRQRGCKSHFFLKRGRIVWYRQPRPRGSAQFGASPPGQCSDGKSK
jgi:uncharacterized protein DUF6527